MADLLTQARLITQGRRWRIGQDCGAVFDDDDDFDGFTLVIELTAEESKALAAKLLEPPPPNVERCEDCRQPVGAPHLSWCPDA